MGPLISCVISVWNEEQTIVQVVEAALACPEIRELIVVDDGSSDRTKGLVGKIRHPKLKLISQTHQGKAEAIHTGQKLIHSQLVLLLDADLVGLTPKNLSDLLAPSREPNTMSFAFLGNAPGIARMMGINAVSGQRAFPQSLLQKLTWNQIQGFELELELNKVAIEHDFRVAVVHWPTVRHRKKVEKRGFLPGYLEDMQMTFGLIAKYGLPAIIRQYVVLSKRAKESPLF